jgi:DNA-binding MurR/RpiR family transcriptional regulator
MNVLQAIQQDVGEFSKAEEKIAYFLIKNSEQVIHQNIKQVATQIGVSTTSIVRFSKRFSDEGFRGLKLLIAEANQRRIESGELEFQDSYDIIQQKLVGTFDEIQVGINRSIDETKMEQILNIMVGSDELIIGGARWNSEFAQNLANKLIGLGEKINYSADLNVIHRRLKISSDDVSLVLFIDDFLDIDSENLLQTCQKMKIKAVIITNMPKINYDFEVINYSKKLRRDDYINTEAIAKNYLIELLYCNYVIKVYAKQRGKFKAVANILDRFN